MKMGMGMGMGMGMAPCRVADSVRVQGLLLTSVVVVAGCTVPIVLVTLWVPRGVLFITRKGCY